MKLLFFKPFILIMVLLSMNNLMAQQTHIHEDGEALRIDGTNSWLSFYHDNLFKGYFQHTGDLMRMVNLRPGNLQFGTNGVMYTSLSPSGDFGIGTLSPNYKLDVVGDRIRLRNSTSATAKTLMMRTDGSAVDLQSENANFLIRSTGGALFLNPGTPNSGDGGIAIGTGSISSGITLNVGKNMRLNGNGDGLAWTFGMNGLAMVRNGKLAIVDRDENSPKEQGLQLIDNDGSTWSVYTDNANDINFAFEDVLKAYINDTDGSYIQVSDARLKEEIVDSEDILQDLLKLNVYWYKYKNTDTKKKSYGVLAQEVEEIFPDFVHEKDDLKRIAYDNFAILSVKAIQEQHELIKELQEQVLSMKHEIEDLKK